MSDAPPSESGQPPQIPSIAQPVRTHTTIATISAILSLLVFPYVFGPIAIVLGAHAWRHQHGSNRGLYIVILGIVCMILGLYGL